MFFKILARKWAFQYIYQSYFKEKKEMDLDNYFSKLEEFEKISKKYPQKAINAREFTYKITSGYFKYKNKIDKLVKENSKNWDFHRISIVEKSILSICLYEALYLLQKPAIIISESLKLAKLYGDKDSLRFLNGVLDSILKKEVL